MKLFDQDPRGGGRKTAAYNRVTMPSRNYAILAEAEGMDGVPDKSPEAAEAMAQKRPTGLNAGHQPLHAGEVGAGTGHPAAGGAGGGGVGGGGAGGLRGDLQVCLRVEVDRHDREGRTEGYGFSGEWPFPFEG